MPRRAPAQAKVSDRERFKLMRGLTCVACAQLDVPPAYPEGCDVSHLKSGDRRIGHQDTLLECPWHHRAVPPFGFTQQGARKVWGPSRAKSTRAYAERFGNDATLLKLTNAAIARRQRNTVGGRLSPTAEAAIDRSIKLATKRGPIDPKELLEL